MYHNFIVWYGMVWYGMVWYGMVWYGMVWYGMVWYGMYVCMYVWDSGPAGPSPSGGAGRSPGLGDPQTRRAPPPGVGGMLHEMIRTYFELSQSHLNFN